MKKIISMLIVLALCLSVLPAAFAAETDTDTIVVNWSDYDERRESEGWQGGFYLLEDLGFMIWIPDTMAPSELSEEEVANGDIALFTTEDGEFFVYVGVMDTGLEADQIENLLTGMGAETVTKVLINGIPFHTGTVEYEDGSFTNVAIFAGEDGCIMQVMFPGGNADFDDVSMAIMSSVQVYTE